jgi:hypothetical protein
VIASVDGATTVHGLRLVVDAAAARTQEAVP